MQESVFLIAGASGGIGRSIASALLSVGAEVMLLGRSMAKLRAALPSCDPGKGLFLVADLTDAAAIERVSSAVSQRGRLDAVILSSGIYERSDDPEVFRRQITANVLGPYALIQALLPALLNSKGQVIFINSSQALRASATVGQYAATMHATKAQLARRGEFKRVRVTSLYLGRTAGERQQKIFELEGRPYLSVANAQNR